MTIYNSKGNVILEAPVTKEAIIKYVLMEDYYIELPFYSNKLRKFPRGSYILHKGRKFEIMSVVRPEYQSNTGGYKYTLKFEAQQSHMKRRKVFWLKSTNAETSFHDTTFLADFGQLIADNMNRFLGGENWKVAAVPSDLAETAKLVSFNGDFCWDALNRIAETFECEWWTVDNGTQVWIYFGKLEFGTPEQFERGKVVTSIPAKKGDDSNYGTRFYVFGSTRNLPDDYDLTEQGGITNHVSEKRLHLPNGMQYIDAWDNIEQADIVEQVAFFDDIFPKNTETVTSVTTIPRKVENTDDPNATFDAYVVYCADTPFLPSDIYEGETLMCKFTSGSLNGREFELAIIDNNNDNIDPEKWKPEDGFNKKFEIIADVEQIGEDNVLTIPNESLHPEPGDTFVLTGVKLPQERITEAENELLEVGKAWAKKNSSDTDVYDCPTNPVYCQRADKNYELGQKVILIDDRFGDTGRQSRIQGFEKKLWNEYEATYTVGDNASYSRLGSIETDISESAYAERIGVVSGVGIYLIRSKYDTTQPTDYNAYSALATEALFLNKRKGGTVTGDIAIGGKLITTDFRAGLIGGAGLGIYKDENGNTVVEVDRVNVRQDMQVNTVVINQAEGRGGMEIDTAAFMTVTRVEDTDEGYVCYFDQKNGSVANLFHLDDVAYCQRWTPENASLKFYKRRVVAVGDDNITLSKTDVNGTGIPAEDDNIIHFGNYTDATRQYVKVRDVIGGGYERYLGDLDSVNAQGVEYYFVGRQAGMYGGKPRWFIGERKEVANADGTTSEVGEYAEWVNGKLIIKGSISVQSTIGGDTIDEYIKKVSPPVKQEDIEQFVTNIVDPKIEEIQNQIDGVIETWFYNGVPTLTNYPASEWNTDALKIQHLGDLYYDNDTGTAYRFSQNADGGYYWNTITDDAITKALAAAQAAQDTADGKRRIFTSQPVPPYDKGDLWVNATYGTQYSNDILRCITAKASGASFDIGDWTLASKYTDDTALNTFISGYQQTIGDIQTQIDGKAQTWYQATDPSTSWTTTEVKAEHKGDLWYCTADIAGTNYKKGTTWYWTGTAWAQQDIPQSVFDTIDGKAEIFVSKPTSGYHKHDLWFLEADYTLSGVEYKEGTLVVAKNDMGTSWSADDWTKKDNYTDDTLAKDALDRIAGLDYLKNALVQDTTISGGLIMSTLISLGYTGSDDVRHTLAGMNGSYVPTLGGRTIGSWWGGSMIDLFDANDDRISPAPANAATSLVRMDGSVYWAKGNIGFRADGSGWLGNDLTGIKFTSDGAMTFGSGVTFDVTNVSGLKTTLDSLANFTLGIDSLLKPCDAAGNEISWQEASQSDGAGGIRAKSIKAKVGLWSVDFLTAKGRASGSIGGGDDGGGGFGYDRLDAWADYDAAKAGYVLSAGLGWDLKTRIDNLPTTSVNPHALLFGGKSYDGSTQVTLTAADLGALTEHQSLAAYLKTDGSNGTYAGVNALINKLQTATNPVTDALYFVTSNIDPTASTNYYRRPASVLWSYIKGKTDALYLTAHQPIHALTIQRNGTDVGTYTPNSAAKTINIDDVASAATLTAHTGNTTVHITAAERTKWNKVVTDFAAITGTDSDSIINKWEEVVAFLDTYTEADTLAGLLSNKADKTQLADYVTLATAQTISGAKTFSSIMTVKQVRAAGVAGSWVNGRTNALLRTTTVGANQYVPLWSAKTQNGSWDCGPCTSDTLHFSYITDAHFNAQTNIQTASFRFTTAGQIQAKSFRRDDGTASQFLKADGSVDGTAYLPKSTFDDLFEKVNIGTASAPVYAIRAKYGLYTDYFLTAKGVASGDMGGGSGTDYDRLDSWADYDSGKAGYVLSALLGHDLDTRVKSLEGGAAVGLTTTGTGNAITSISKSGTTITAVKGATFSLASHTHNWLVKPADERATATVPNDYNGKFAFTGMKNRTALSAPGTSTYVNGFGWRGWADSSGGHAWEIFGDNSNLYCRCGSTTAWGAWKIFSFDGHTHAFASLTGKPTTLAGYGITDAYTKTQADGRYVTALSTSGNYLTWTKNGATSNITVPYAAKTDILVPNALANGSDLNTYLNTTYGGRMYYKGGGTAVSNAPEEITDAHALSLLNIRISGTMGQLVADTSHRLFYRTGTASSQSAWQRLVTSVNYTSIIGKIGTADVGSATRPIYLKAGVPTAGTYTFGNNSGNAALNNGTLNTNLNADKLDGYHITDYQTGGWYAMTTYVYDATNGTRHYWHNIASIGTCNKHVAIEILVMDDGNYASIHRCVLSLSSYSSTYATKSIALSSMPFLRGNVQAMLTASGEVWIRFQDITWTSFARFRLLYGDYATSGIVLHTAPTKQEATPTGSDIISDGGGIRLNVDSGAFTYTGMSVAGNAASATKLYTARTINGSSFNGTANITTSYWGTARNISIADATAAHTGDAVSVNGSAAVTLKLPATITAALVGNASSATKLATARTLWGRSFNGTANVSGNMTDVGSVAASGTYTITFPAVSSALSFKLNNSTYEIGLHIGSGGVNRGIYDWTNSNWMIYRDATTNVLIPQGNVGIGSTPDPDYKLHVNGKLGVAGNIMPTATNAYSVGTSSLLYAAMYARRLKTVTPKSSLERNICLTESAQDYLIFSDTQAATYLRGSMIGFQNVTGTTCMTISGGAVAITGTLSLTKTQDLSGTANNSPALIIGGNSTATHLELDSNELQAKASGVTVGPLYLNLDGGLVVIGSGGLEIRGALKATGAATLSSTLGVAGASTFTGKTTHNGGLAATTATFSGKVGIGTTAPVEEFHVVGTIHSTVGIYSDGYVTAKGQNTSSDMRLKNKIRDIVLSVRDIARAPIFEHTWKDGTPGTMVGTSAQYWQGILPSSVTMSKDGRLSMFYDHAAMVGVVSLARGVELLERRVARLERENRELKEQLLKQAA